MGSTVLALGIMRIFLFAATGVMAFGTVALAGIGGGGGELLEMGGSGAFNDRTMAGPEGSDASDDAAGGLGGGKGGGMCREMSPDRGRNMLSSLSLDRGCDISFDILDISVYAGAGDLSSFDGGCASNDQVVRTAAGENAAGGLGLCHMGGGDCLVDLSLAIFAISVYDGTYASGSRGGCEMAAKD